MHILENKFECMGCHGCANICPKSCIEMTQDKEGFTYPVINYDKCINCKACVKVCPINIKNPTNSKKPISYACYNKEESIREKSSSGGIFYLLADYIIQLKGVVFGAAFDNNWNVCHTEIEDIKNIAKLQGSKYVQSLIKNSYAQVKKYLSEDRYVLFSGTPCQIAGLKAFLGYEKIFPKLLCVDFICHGVPSPKVWKKYIYYLEHKHGEINSINFRNKKNGWKDFNFYVDFMSGHSICVDHYKDDYMLLFLKNIILRPSCYECHFKGISNRLSDFTIADFWGIDNVDPNMNDNKGTSLILLHSELALYIYKKLKIKLQSAPVEIDQAIKYNLSAIQSVQIPKNRNAFFNQMDEGNFEKKMKKYAMDTPLDKILKFEKRVFRKLRRVLKVAFVHGRKKDQ